MSTNPPIPGVPSTQPAPQAPAATQAQAPAATPSPVQYAPDTAVVKTTVNGRSQDVTVADMKAGFQLRSAAELKMQQAGQLLNQYRGAIDFDQRIRTLAQSNPQAAMEEVQKHLGLRSLPAARDQNSQTDGDEPDARDRAILSKLSTLEQRLAANEQFREQVTTQNVVTQIRSAVSQLPLYAKDADMAARAERVVLAYLTTNPEASVRDVAGAIHSDDEAFLTRQLQSLRDQRATDAQVHASIPTTAGTPQLTMPEMPKLTPEQLRGKGFRNAFSAFGQTVRKTAGI